MNRRRKWVRERELAQAVGETRRYWLKTIHSGEPYWKDEIFVDSFAGGGGASTGIELAIGRSVDEAINHDPSAIAMHEANHPHTQHRISDVWKSHPKVVAAGRKVGLLWLSPDCTHHSKARGGKPREKGIRGLAWVAVWWAATVRPRVIMLENVEEFEDWGPLNAEGKPVPSQKGRTFRTFVNALRRQGYAVEWRTLRACDYGAPTTRKRLFMIARCDGQPIIWPNPSHADVRTPVVQKGKAAPYRTAAGIIDWSIPCPSIFERKRPLAPNTMRRIARGIGKFVINNPDPYLAPFIIKVNHSHDEAFRGQRIDEPLQTITGKNGWGIVTPQLAKLDGWDSRSGPQLATAAFLAKHYGGNYNGPGADLRDPLPTITVKDHNALVTALLAEYQPGIAQAKAGTLRPEDVGLPDSLVASHLIKFRRDNIGSAMDEPVPTITAGGNHMGAVYAFLVAYYGSSVGQDMNDPLATITTHDRFGLVLVHVKGVPYVIVDIGMRMLTPRELYNAQGFPSNYVINPTVNGKPFSQAEQVAKCGNSVSPVIPKALVRANLPEHCAGSGNMLRLERYADQVGQLQLSI